MHLWGMSSEFHCVGKPGVTPTLGKVSVAVRAQGSWRARAVLRGLVCSRSQCRAQNIHTPGASLPVRRAKGEAFTCLISHFSLNVCMSLKDGYGQQLTSVTDLLSQTHEIPWGSEVSVLMSCAVRQAGSNSQLCCFQLEDLGKLLRLCEPTFLICEMGMSLLLSG